VLTLAVLMPVECVMCNTVVLDRIPLGASVRSIDRGSCILLPLTRSQQDAVKGWEGIRSLAGVDAFSAGSCSSPLLQYCMHPWLSSTLAILSVRPLSRTGVNRHSAGTAATVAWLHALYWPGADGARHSCSGQRGTRGISEGMSTWPDRPE
jgi:hypothetical protein